MKLPQLFFFLLISHIVTAQESGIIFQEDFEAGTIQEIVKNWMHMRGCARPDYFWGNIFKPNPPAPINREERICVELMMKINDPVDSYNGEQAFWINGEKIHHFGEGYPNGYWIWDKFIPDPDSLPFEGFQWRNDAKLNLNFFLLLYYMTDGVTEKSDTIWFDDIVVSTKYIESDLSHNKQ